MKIQKCTICDKPFFNDPKTTTDYAMDFDPTACPQCNENARQNSVPPIKPDNILIIQNQIDLLVQFLKEREKAYSEAMKEFFPYP